MLKDLFEQKRQYLEYFFQSLDLGRAQKFLDVLSACKGTIVLTGIGKSGLVAKKIAVTMISTGTRAHFLSPANAMHGDLGILNHQDVFIFLSKSGESEELLNLVPFVRNKNTKILGIVSNGESRLAKACDLTITLPLLKELCPYNLAPTTSTAIQMIFGDVLSIALMKHNNFSMDEYVKNHPGGSIGKRMLIKVRDLMITGQGLPLCAATDKLVDVLVELSNKRCGCVLVVDDKMIMQGIFTDGDLRRTLVSHGSKALEFPIQEIMTRKPRHITDGKLAWEAMQQMEADQKRAITCMPVLEEESRKLLGLIRLHDIIQSGI